MSDDNLLDGMAELRAKCEKLCRTPMDNRNPIRDRIGELLAAYLKIMIPEPRLTEVKTQAFAGYDAHMVRTVLDGLNDHERRAGISALKSVG